MASASARPTGVTDITSCTGSSSYYDYQRPRRSALCRPRYILYIISNTKDDLNVQSLLRSARPPSSHWALGALTPPIEAIGYQSCNGERERAWIRINRRKRRARDADCGAAHRPGTIASGGNFASTARTACGAQMDVLGHFSSYPCAKSPLRGAWVASSGMVFTHKLAGDHGAEDIVRTFADCH